MSPALLGLALAACAPHATPTLSWDFEARPTRGEVLVLPVVVLYDAPSLRLDSYVTETVPWYREQVRRERTTALSQVPGAVALALPGAVNAELGREWDGRFGVGRFPVMARERLVLALRNGGDLEGALRDLGQRAGGDAVLVTWVAELDGAPLTAEGFPGDIVATAVGPVMVDHDDEPYVVTARVGTALVTADGEVVLRYEDVFEGVLSSVRPPADTGRQIARSLAGELSTVWPCDPRLLDGEPLFARR